MTCKTCKHINNIQERIELYKDDYAKYDQVEKLFCAVVQCSYHKKRKKYTASSIHGNVPLKYCPECGTKLKGQNNG